MNKPWEHNPGPSSGCFSKERDQYFWGTLVYIGKQVDEHSRRLGRIEGGLAVAAAIGTILLGLVLGGVLPK